MRAPSATPCDGCRALAVVHVTGSCYRCWPRLPGNLRTAILKAWGRRQHGEPGALDEHETARAAAAAWFEANPL